ncbi:hypothetical protein [Ruegeria arenilitoris]|uniref:hypothetical protein n=1 Tax=Ruegeria arenilitoris TaxID=1173585 RepID=UPI00147DAF92|nr:hypothetical protein [Ruegeria arenilitoris]
MPHDIKRSHRGGITSDMNRYQLFWQSILHTVVMDALGHCTTAAPYERADIVHIARAYLCFSNDLFTVADLANCVDGETIRKWAMEQRKNGWQDAVAHPEDFIKAA